jgi:hypothetical protein
MCLVPPSAFADTYYDRPTDPICVGLRTIADGDVNAARSQAQKWADKSHPNATLEDPERFSIWIECYNDALLRWMVARGTCDPNDVTQSPECWNVAPEDQVREALTSDGVLLVYDEWERMRVSVDPTKRDAGDGEILEGLPKLLPFAKDLPSLRRGRLRRLLAFVLDELASVASDEALIAPTDPNRVDVLKKQIEELAKEVERATALRSTA